MAEHEPPGYDRCAICGRTILRGERLWEYLEPDGQRHFVCSLCKERAEAAGWLTADQAARLATLPSGRQSRRQALRERVSRASQRAAELARGRGGEESRDGEAMPERPQRQRGASRQQRRPAQREAPERPERTKASRRPADARQAARQALEQFNASAEARTVAGLIRSLGEPSVSVHARDSSLRSAVVTVAWELSWYQWEVSAGEAGGGVREIGKGNEISELSEDDRRWNARTDDDGRLRLGDA